jgi:hypothetical protein
MPRCVVSGFFCLVGFGLFLTVTPVHSASHRPAGAQKATRVGGKVCPGFVVLPNGQAVLSRLPEKTSRQAHPSRRSVTAEQERTAAGHDHVQQTDASQQGQMTHGGHGQGASMPQRAKPSKHLMGYWHGQAITPKKRMLCVPLGRRHDKSWTAVSRQLSLFVTAESLRGRLTHRSRANEGFRLTVMRPGSGQPLDEAEVRLLARMPHHDHRMPGGHGPANDPEGRGIVAQREPDGRYLVGMVNFTMAGPWLFEVQVRQGEKSSSAYFAVLVGE